MSKIEWTEQTWNPISGCSKVSAGCKNCYAEPMTNRLAAMGVAAYAAGFGKVVCHADKLDLPRRRKKPTLYFVNSMADMFHEDVPRDFLDKMMTVMRETPQHTYQILTKRAMRMAAYFGDDKLPPNVWVGVSVENVRHGLPRIGFLRHIRGAAVRFLSVEPLLEYLGDIDLRAVDWVIVGGESGKGARPMEERWVRSVRRQCVEQGVPFFFKQWGAFGGDGKRRSKAANGRRLDCRTYDAMPMVFERGVVVAK